VNWIKQPANAPGLFVLDNAEVEGIDTALTESTIPIADVPVLPANTGRAFQGFLPGAKFDITVEEARTILAAQDAHYEDVVLPYLDGRDITRTIDQSPTRYTIDFGQTSLERAMGYPAALEILREQAQEAREQSTSYHRNPRWWQFLWPRPEFRSAVCNLGRFIAGTATAKRVLFIWCESMWRPSNATNVFAFDSDYAMGVLTSRIHTGWAAKKSSTLEDRIRYTPSSAFDTFPWPQATNDQREQIGALARELLAMRAALCAEHAIGLTVLYNRLDDGAFDELRSLHRELDIAVIAAYGWEAAVLGDMRERNRRLYELNRQITCGEVGYAGPG
jgi:hypothetical protein